MLEPSENDGGYKRMDGKVGVFPGEGEKTPIFSPFAPMQRGGIGMVRRGLREGDEKGKPKRRQWEAEQKLHIVIESLESSEPNIKICRRYGISEPTLYKWRQQFFDGGKIYLAGPRRPKVADLLQENQCLKEILGEVLLALRKGARTATLRRLRRLGFDERIA